MRRRMMLIVALGLLVSSCANDDSGPTAAGGPSPTTAPTPTPTWGGYPQPEEGAGEISVTEFNEFVEATNPPWRTSPLRSALEFLQGGPPSQEPPPVTTTVIQKTSAYGGTEASVTLTEEGVGDDSIAAVRYRLEFRLEDDGSWLLVSAFTDHLCGRGPQTEEFTLETCL